VTGVGLSSYVSTQYTQLQRCGGSCPRP
jgi:hypothetical protein